MADPTIERRSGARWSSRIGNRYRSLRSFGPWWWWMWTGMQLSDWPVLGRVALRLAALPLGPYRQTWPLARISSKPYVSPRADIACSELHVDPRCWIDDFVTIYGSRSGGSVHLREQVHLHRGTIIEVGLGSRVVIGEGTHIQAGCHISARMADIIIGTDAMVAPQCGFFSYQHATSDLSRPMCKQGLISRGDIVIEDDVWLGMGAKVMDGVRIGRGAIVGAGAVVTEDIPEYAIALGVPARVVRRRAG